jgi:hypothetical protein
VTDEATKYSEKSAPLSLVAGAADAFITGFAKMRHLVVGLEDRIRIIHGAAHVKAMLQAKGVTQLVYALFERTLEEQVGVGILAVKLRA